MKPPPNSVLCWWCYQCCRHVPHEHIKMVLSHKRKTGRCEYKPKAVQK